MTWACWDAGTTQGVFYADQDMTHFPGVICERLDRLEIEARTAYYIIKGLGALRKAVV